MIFTIFMIKIFNVFLKEYFITCKNQIKFKLKSINKVSINKGHSHAQQLTNSLWLLSALQQSCVVVQTLYDRQNRKCFPSILL